MTTVDAHGDFDGKTNSARSTNHPSLFPFSFILSPQFLFYLFFIFIVYFLKFLIIFLFFQNKTQSELQCQGSVSAFGSYQPKENQSNTVNK